VAGVPEDLNVAAERNLATLAMSAPAVAAAVPLLAIVVSLAFAVPLH